SGSVALRAVIASRPKRTIPSKAAKLFGLRIPNVSIAGDYRIRISQKLLMSFSDEFIQAKSQGNRSDISAGDDVLQCCAATSLDREAAQRIPGFHYFLHRRSTAANGPSSDALQSCDAVSHAADVYEGSDSAGTIAVQSSAVRGTFFCSADVAGLLASVLALDRTQPDHAGSNRVAAEKTFSGIRGGAGHGCRAGRDGIFSDCHRNHPGARHHFPAASLCAGGDLP